MESTASDLAKLAKADIVVPNGAGYDGWAEKAQLDKKRQTIGNAGDLMGVNAAYADKAGAGSATATTVQRHFNDRKKPSRKWTTGPRITRCP